MGTLSELADEVRGDPRTTKSKVDDILNGLDDSDRDVLEGLLRDAQVSPHRLSRALAPKGIQVSPTALNRWRDLNGVAP